MLTTDSSGTSINSNKISLNVTTNIPSSLKNYDFDKNSLYVSYLLNLIQVYNIKFEKYVRKKFVKTDEGRTVLVRYKKDKFCLEVDADGDGTTLDENYLAVAVIKEVFKAPNNRMKAKIRAYEDPPHTIEVIECNNDVLFGFDPRKFNLTPFPLDYKVPEQDINFGRAPKKKSLSSKCKTSVNNTVKNTTKPANTFINGRKSSCNIKHLTFPEGLIVTENRTPSPKQFNNFFMPSELHTPPTGDTSGLGGLQLQDSSLDVLLQKQQSVWSNMLSYNLDQDQKKRKQSSSFGPETKKRQTESNSSTSSVIKVSRSDRIQRITILDTVMKMYENNPIAMKMFKEYFKQEGEALTQDM